MRRKQWILPLLCYALALLVYMGLCLFHVARDSMHQNQGLLPLQALPAEQLESDGIQFLAAQNGRLRLVSTDGDPKLIYRPEQPFYATRLTWQATALNKPGGEIVLYYTTEEDEPFSERKKLWARQAGDGSWYFDLSGRRYTGLRLDPGTASGVLWEVEKLALNEPKPPADYWLPDARQLSLLVFAPLFAAAVLREAYAALRLLGIRRQARRTGKQQK